MKQYVEIDYLDIKENTAYEKLINKVIDKCFEVENLADSNLYISVILTSPKNIRNLNKQYRNIDEETDVLSFPMFEKQEIENIMNSKTQEVLGDIVISIDRVKTQAEEYGHTFERELAYMAVHGFYHIMGEDHMNEKDKDIMREKEEKILSELKMLRDN